MGRRRRRWARKKDAWTIFIELRQRLVENEQSYEWLKFGDIREKQKAKYRQLKTKQ
jgi:hypothetical protein